MSKNLCICYEKDGIEYLLTYFNGSIESARSEVDKLNQNSKDTRNYFVSEQEEFD